MSGSILAPASLSIVPAARGPQAIAKTGWRHRVSSRTSRLYAKEARRCSNVVAVGAVPNDDHDVVKATVDASHYQGIITRIAACPSIGRPRVGDTRRSSVRQLRFDAAFLYRSNRIAPASRAGD
jgi:hypothetical protein